MRKLFALAAVIVLAYPAAAHGFTIEEVLGTWCNQQHPFAVFALTRTNLKIRKLIDPRPPSQEQNIRITKFEVIAPKRAIVHWFEDSLNAQTAGQSVYELSDDKQRLTMADASDDGKESPKGVLRRCVNGWE